MTVLQNAIAKGRSEDSTQPTRFDSLEKARVEDSAQEESYLDERVAEEERRRESERLKSQVLTGRDGQPLEPGPQFQAMEPTVTHQPMSEERRAAFREDQRFDYRRQREQQELDQYQRPAPVSVPEPDLTARPDPRFRVEAPPAPVDPDTGIEYRTDQGKQLSLKSKIYNPDTGEPYERVEPRDLPEIWAQKTKEGMRAVPLPDGRWVLVKGDYQKVYDPEQDGDYIVNELRPLYEFQTEVIGERRALPKLEQKQVAQNVKYLEDLHGKSPSKAAALTFFLNTTEMARGLWNSIIPEATGLEVDQPPMLGAGAKITIEGLEQIAKEKSKEVEEAGYRPLIAGQAQTEKLITQALPLVAAKMLRAPESDYGFVMEGLLDAAPNIYAAMVHDDPDGGTLLERILVDIATGAALNPKHAAKVAKKLWSARKSVVPEVKRAFKESAQEINMAVQDAKNTVKLMGRGTEEAALRAAKEGPLVPHSKVMREEALAGPRGQVQESYGKALDEMGKEARGPKTLKAREDWAVEPTPARVEPPARPIIDPEVAPIQPELITPTGGMRSPAAPPTAPLEAAPPVTPPVAPPDPGVAAVAAPPPGVATRYQPRGTSARPAKEETVKLYRGERSTPLDITQTGERRNITGANAFEVVKNYAGDTTEKIGNNFSSALATLDAAIEKGTGFSKQGLKSAQRLRKQLAQWKKQYDADPEGMAAALRETIEGHRDLVEKQANNLLWAAEDPKVAAAYARGLRNRMPVDVADLFAPREGFKAPVVVKIEKQAKGVLDLTDDFPDGVIPENQLGSLLDELEVPADLKARLIENTTAEAAKRKSNVIRVNMLFRGPSTNEFRDHLAGLGYDVVRHNHRTGNVGKAYRQAVILDKEGAKLQELTSGAGQKRTAVVGARGGAPERAVSPGPGAAELPGRGRTQAWDTGKPGEAAPSGPAFKPAEPEFWKRSRDVDVGEPAPKNLRSTGLIVQEADGRVWIAEPTGAYGGRRTTLPAGRMEEGLTAQQTALKETFEETGLQAKITGYAGDFVDPNNGTVRRFYTARRTGGQPWSAKIEEGIIDPKTGQAAAESSRVMLMDPEEAFKVLTHGDDSAALKAALKKAPVAEPPPGVATRYKPTGGATKKKKVSKRVGLRSEEEITQEIQSASGVPIQTAQLKKERFGSPRHQAINKELEKSKKELEKLNFKLDRVAKTGKKTKDDPLRVPAGPERDVLLKQRDDVRAYIKDRKEALLEAAPDKPLRDELRALKKKRKKSEKAGEQAKVKSLDEKIVAAEKKLDNLYPVGIYEKAGERGATPRGLATVTKRRDTSTALHEAVEGWIDRGRLKEPAKTEIHDELVAFAKERFPDTDPAKIDWKEGASEAAVAWFEDEIDQFSKATQRWLDKNFKRFRRARDQARQFRTATGKEIIEQARTAPQGGRSRYKQLVREKGYAKGTHKYFKDMYRDWHSAWIDRPGGLFDSMNKLGVGSRAGKFERTLKKPTGEDLYRALERTQGGRVAAYVNHGEIWTPYGYIKNKSLPQIAQDAGSEEVFHDAFTALRAQRSKDLWKRGKKNPIPESEADATLAEFKAKYTGDKAKLLKKTKSDIVKWHDGVFQYAVESGAMTEESVKVMRELDPSYVPFTRDLRSLKEQGLIESFKSGGGPGAGVTRMKGSERHALMDPIQAMIGDVDRFLRGLDENVVKQQIIADIEMTPGGGVLVQRLDKAPADATEFVKRAREELMAAGIHPSELSDGGDSIMNVVASIPALANKKTANILHVVENGKVIAYKVAPVVFNAFSKLPSSMLKGFTRTVSTLATSDNLFSKSARALSNVKRATATTYTLTFPIRNAERDILLVLNKKGHEAPEIISKGFLKGIKGWAQKTWHGQYTDDIMEAYQVAGVRTGRVTYKSTNAKSVQRLYKDLIRNPKVRKAVNILENIGDLLRLPEDAPRIGAGMQAIRKAGYTGGKLTPNEMVKFINAFENITVPFKRGGGAAKDLNLVSTFLNARLQAVVNFARAHPVKAMLSGNKKKAALAKVTKSMLFGLTTTTIPELYLATKYKDEDWYKNLPTWRKTLFLNVRYGGKTWSLPRNPEWGFFYGVLPRVMAFENDNMEELTEAMGDMLDVVDIPAIGTPLAIARNYDPFRKQSIEPRYDRRIKSERASEFTGEHYKKLAKFFNGILGEDSERAWSPDELRYLAESYFTSTMREGGMLLGFNKPSEKQSAYDKIPFWQRVQGAKPTRGRHIDKVYDLRKKLEGNKSRTPGQEKTLEEIKKFFQKELPKTKGRKRRRPPGAGRKLLDELREANKAGELAKVHELSEKRNTLFREKFEAWSKR